jgi:hypothetical protein
MAKVLNAVEEASDFDAVAAVTGVVLVVVLMIRTP